jgi:guanylate kinase
LNKGLLIVICGPSGAGKTTLCDRLQEKDLGQNLVTCSTRPARAGEISGKHYHFLSTEEFQQGIGDNQFVEHAKVHGNLYGIRRGDIKKELTAGNTAILNIDVQGAESIRQLFPDNILDIFIDIPCLDTLKKRLETRKKDSAEVIQKRLSEAQEERKRQGEFSKVFINDDLEACYKELEGFIICYRKGQHV